MARRGDRQIMTVVDTADEVKQWIAKTDEQLVRTCCMFNIFLDTISFITI